MFPGCTDQGTARKLSAVSSPEAPGLVQRHPSPLLCAAPTVAAQSCSSLGTDAAMSECPPSEKSSTSAEQQTEFAGCSHSQADL